MRLLKAAIISLLMFGCTPDSEEARNRRVIEYHLDTMSKYLEYYKDVNKNVCYAMGYDSRTLTSVPCTPEVERTAHQFHSNQTVR